MSLAMQFRRHLVWITRRHNVWTDSGRKRVLSHMLLWIATRVDNSDQRSAFADELMRHMRIMDQPLKVDE